METRYELDKAHPYAERGIDEFMSLDQSKHSIYGASKAAVKLMSEALYAELKDKEVKQPVRPANVVGMNVCNLTGLAIPEEGCESHFEYFKK